MKSGWIVVAGALLVVCLGRSVGDAFQSLKPASNPPAVIGSKKPPDDRARLSGGAKSENTATPASDVFDGEAAFAMLKSVVALGPRITGSEAMKRQQEMLQKHFESLGAKVWFHEFPINHPVSGKKVIVKNMIVTWHPDRHDRIMLCTHFDTRPQADKDPKNPKAKFHGANDGASGVGLFAELGRHMPAIAGDFGVDFVFFDAEEFVFDARRDPLFVGSTGYANAYAATKDRKFTYEFAVLIDMIGDKHLDLYWETNSFRSSEVLCREIWSVAEDLGVVEFRPEIRHEIRDDHLPLIEFAKIPTIDIIDFDYPTLAPVVGRGGGEYWHTQKDVPENCSAESLGKVGSVLLEWIRRRAAK